MAGEFAQLLPFKWRDLELPIKSVQVTIRQDLVEHKYWNVDGARVEATGVEAVRISAVIPITNSIVPGKNERWQPGALYPDALRKFVLAFRDKTAGTLQHPEFGEFLCKPEQMTFELSGERQDSTEIQASWIETLDDELVLLGEINSPVQEIELAASDLNASGVDLRELVPELPEFTETLESLGRQLTSIADRVTIFSYRAAGIVNRILYQANRIEVAVLRAKSALTWPVIQNIQRIKAAAYSLRRNLLSTTGVGLYTVPSTTTLAGVLLSLPPGTPMGEVLRYNPSLARSPVVRSGTIVRYPIKG